MSGLVNIYTPATAAGVCSKLVMKTIQIIIVIFHNSRSDFAGIVLTAVPVGMKA